MNVDQFRVAIVPDAPDASDALEKRQAACERTISELRARDGAVLIAAGIVRTATPAEFADGTLLARIEGMAAPPGWEDAVFAYAAGSVDAISTFLSSYLAPKVPTDAR